MSSKTLQIDRDPVLTLWATIVAERLGYDHNSALTLSKAIVDKFLRTKLAVYANR